jgi:uncharacterized protein
MYQLKCRTSAGTPVALLYDPHRSTLTLPDGHPLIADARAQPFIDAPRISPEHPGAKSPAPRTLKIQLGLRCNYSCSYCNQRSEVDTATVSRTADAQEFLAKLDTWLQGTPEKIEFWGGEPFLYFAKLRHLVPALRARYPEAMFLIVTNGSLIDPEIIDFIEEHDIKIAVSHDGPAQAQRGPDPFDDPARAGWLRELWRRRGASRSVSFNMVFTSKNNDLQRNLAWFSDKIGDPGVAVSTEGAVSAYDDETLHGSGHWSEADYAAFRRSIVAGFETGDALRYDTILEKARDFVDSLHQQRPSSALGQKCGMDRDDELAVDLKGNVMTCQNTGAEGRHGIGSVFDLPATRLDTSHHWSTRECCNHCPVLQLCKGGCMYLEDELFAQSCENEFHYNQAILAGVLKRISGLELEEISGDIRRPRAKKIIPIRPAAAA